MEESVKQRQDLTLEERERITEIQDLLIDRCVQHKEVTEKGRLERSKELEAEIEELQREKKNWAVVRSV
jgi:hypothetical protein